MRLAAALADRDASRETPEQYLAGVAELVVSFLFCFALERLLAV